MTTRAPSGSSREKAMPDTAALWQNRFQGALLGMIDFEGGIALMKNYSGASALFRSTCGRYMARREAAAYKRLHGVRGVPRLLARRSPDELILEYVEGRDSREEAAECFSNTFFEELRALLAEVRRRGVLHGDVRRNAMRSAEGTVVLTDFGASFVIPWWMWPHRGWLLRIGALYDERAVIKLKQEVAPQLVTDEERVILTTRVPWERLVKRCERVLHTATGWVTRILA